MKVKMKNEITNIISIAKNIEPVDKYRLNILLSSNVIRRELMHSDILVTLIDVSFPGGKERLEKFLQITQSPIPLSYSDVDIFRERYNIDILIQYKDKDENNIFIIIENKIDASDRKRQIENYVDLIKENYNSNFNIQVFYLTPFGTQASTQSMGKYSNLVKNISYNKDILNWLKTCESTSSDSNIKHNIRIYREAVEIMGKEIINLQIASEAVFENKGIEPSQVLAVLEASYRYMHDQFLNSLKKQISKMNSEMGKNFKEFCGNAKYDDEYGLLYKVNDQIDYSIGFESRDSAAKDFYLYTGLKSIGKINPDIRKKMKKALKFDYKHYYDDDNYYIYAYTRHSEVGGGSYKSSDTKDYSLKEWNQWAKDYANDFIEDYYRYVKTVKNL